MNTVWLSHVDPGSGGPRASVQHAGPLVDSDPRSDAKVYLRARMARS